MKKIFFIPLTLLFFLISLSCFIWWDEATRPKDPSFKRSVSFVVPRGFSASQVGKKLQDEGLIRSSLAFKIYFQFQGKSSQIKAGEYQISPSETMQQIVNKLISGPRLFWVTFPEGLRKEEIALKLIKELNIENSPSFYNQFLEESKGKEGFLFPDTYLLPKEITADKFVSLLYNNFLAKTKPLENDIKRTGMSLEQVIILASIIERETRSESERPIVAGILIKRLKSGWPLQVDASVQYAVATKNCIGFNPDCKWWPILTKNDMDINSPFNSYKFKGLPPTPISNPGISSIKAVIYPKESEYWFYLHDNKGKVYFAKTLEEHQSNVRNYLGK